MLENDPHCHTGFDVGTSLSIHRVHFYKSRSRFKRDLLSVNYGPVVAVGVGVSEGNGVNVSVGVGVRITGIDVSVGNAVGGIAVGEMVADGTGVGRLSPSVTRFSA